MNASDASAYDGRRCPAKNKPGCILFDLDGTLVDTAPDLAYAANQVRIELGLDPLPLDAYRSSASNGARGLLKVALDVTPDAPGYGALKDRFLFHYRQHLAEDSRLFAGVGELLRAIECAGLRWGIVTNKVGALTLPLVAALGLVERCACIVSGDSTPHPKPAPDPLLLACSQAGVAPNTCLFVGDDERDIVAGRAARMATAVAQWGYLGHNTDFRAWGADALLACPGDIIDLIELRRAA